MQPAIEDLAAIGQPRASQYTVLHVAANPYLFLEYLKLYQYAPGPSG